MDEKKNREDNVEGTVDRGSPHPHNIFPKSASLHSACKNPAAFLHSFST